MIVVFLIFLFVVFIIALGNPHPATSDLYFELDFNELYETGKKEEEEPVTTSKIKVAGQPKKPKSPPKATSDSEAAADAQAIYSEIDME